MSVAYEIVTRITNRMRALACKAMLEVAPAMEKKTGIHPDVSRWWPYIQGCVEDPGPSGVLLKVGHCYVAVSISEHWSSPQRILFEEYIMADGSGPFEDVLDGLRHYARDMGCEFVSIGSLGQLRDRAYGRLLTQHGMKEVARTYMIGA